MNNRHTRERGYTLLLVLVYFSVTIVGYAGFIDYLTTYSRSTRQAVASTQALALAEAGIDKAVYSLNQDSNYSGETNTVLGDGMFTVSIVSGGSTRHITATGYVPNSTAPKATRIIKTSASVGTSEISFRYGVQAGAGGFLIDGGSTINGSVYSNGDIDAQNGSTITGSATAANAAATTIDQANATPVPIAACTSSTCVTFGNANATQDFAQSFRISSATAINNIQFYIKKVSTPADITVRIVNDASGSPGSEVLMTSALPASRITTSFGWVTVTMPSTPVLDPDQTYWIVIDAGTHTNRYYIIGANTSYTSGVGKIGQHGGSWSATSPAGLDGYFQIALGGQTSMIGGDTYAGGVLIGSTAADNAWAHEVRGATVSGIIYCQVGATNNKACNTSQATPSPQAMPLSDANIQEYKDEALAGGTLTGDYHVDWQNATLGPKKIVGNLLVDGGGTLTVSGTLWVTGTITVTGGGKIKLAASYGTNDGAIVTDGRVTINGGGTFSGSGQTGSYPFLITTSACPTQAGCAGANAITMSGGAGTVALVAQDGTVSIAGGSALKAVTAKQISLDGGATLIYDSGLISTNFSSGPGGSWEIIPGTYVIVR
jgi:hypothetical protein